jgi:hypothetical protein
MQSKMMQLVGAQRHGEACGQAGTDLQQHIVQGVMAVEKRCYNTS